MNKNESEKEKIIRHIRRLSEKEQIELFSDLAKLADLAGKVKLVRLT